MKPDLETGTPAGGPEAVQQHPGEQHSGEQYSGANGTRMDRHGHACERQMAAVARLGLLALREADLEAVVREATGEVARLLDADACDVLPPDASVPAGSLAATIPGRERPYGRLAVHAEPSRTFSDDEVHFVQSVADVLGAAVVRRRSEEVVRFLSEASVALASSLDYGQTLHNVADLLVPAFADWCAIDLLEDDGSVHMVAVAHSDPEKVALAHALRRRYPPHPDEARWVQTNASELIPEVTDELLAASARDEEHLRILRALGLRSAIVVPLVARDRTLGAITLIHAEGGRRYSEADLTPVEELARSCALAVDNARLYGAAQHEIAERKHAEAEVERLNRDLKHRVDELQALLDVSPLGLAVAHDPSCRDITANPALARMLGIPPDQNVSRTSPSGGALPFRVLRDGEEVAVEALPMQYAAAHDVEIRGAEYEIVRGDGVRLTMLEYATPLHDEAGHVRGVLGAFVDITAIKQTEQALREESYTLETINRVNATLAAELDLGQLVQAVTDAGTELSGAQFGAFFYNVVDDRGESYMLYSLSGVPHEAFSSFPMPRNTEVFGPTFGGQGVIRLEDVTQDPRYGKNPPFHGMPEGHLPVRSYLAAPVVSRTGDVLGGLFFGHSEAGVFTERAERIVGGIADQAAIAIENARLFHAAQRELAERKRAQQQLKELNETLEQRVAERTTALAQANERLRAEVGERERAEQALERTNAALLKSNRELQEFAYVASHDLQEPLRKIGSFADLLQGDYGDQLDESGRRYIERMQDAALRMSRLISDLLSFSRIATRGEPFAPTDLEAVVADVLSDLEVRVEEVGGTVDVGPLPTVEVDPTQMRQLFQNLIGNALKFHREDMRPVVRVAAQVETGSPSPGAVPQEVCRITVDDNGIGFDEKYLDRIFSPFQRLHGRNAYEGTGIGLAICRRIAERHNGTITAHSREGEGSTFVITLPVRQAAEENG